MVAAQIHKVLETLKEPSFGLVSKIQEIERNETNVEVLDPRITATVREVDDYVLVELSKKITGVKSMYVIKNSLVKGFKAETFEPRTNGMHILKVGIPGLITTQFGIWSRGDPQSEYTILLGAESVGDDVTVTDLQELSLVRNLIYQDSIKRAVPLNKVHLEISEGYGERWVSVLDNNVYERLERPPNRKNHELPHEWHGKTYDFERDEHFSKLIVTDEDGVNTTTMPSYFTSENRYLLRTFLESDVDWLKLPEIGLSGKPLVTYTHEET
jgi:hypothetical protein